MDDAFEGACLGGRNGRVHFGRRSTVFDGAAVRFVALEAATCPTTQVDAWSYDVTFRTPANGAVATKLGTVQKAENEQLDLCLTSREEALVVRAKDTYALERYSYDGQSRPRFEHALPKGSLTRALCPVPALRGYLAPIWDEDTKRHGVLRLACR